MNDDRNTSIKITYTCPTCGKETRIGLSNTTGCHCAQIPDLHNTPLKIPDAQGTVITMLCKRCNGTGVQRQFKFLYTGDIEEIITPCPGCFGTGFVGMVQETEKQ